MNKILILLVVSMVLSMVVHQGLGCLEEWNNKCVKQGDCCEGLQCWRGAENWKYGVCKKTGDEEVETDSTISTGSI